MSILTEDWQNLFNYSIVDDSVDISNSKINYSIKVPLNLLDRLRRKHVNLNHEFL